MRFHRHKTRRINQQKMILALYMTADDEGLFCVATNEAIGRGAGLTAATAKSYLHQLEDAGIVEVFRPGEYTVNRRVMVLSDHPDAGSIVRRMRRTYGRRSGARA